MNADVLKFDETMVAVMGLALDCREVIKVKHKDTRGLSIYN